MFLPLGLDTQTELLLRKPNHPHGRALERGKQWRLHLQIVGLDILQKGIRHILICRREALEFAKGVDVALGKVEVAGVLREVLVHLLLGPDDVALDVVDVQGDLALGPALPAALSGWGRGGLGLLLEPGGEEVNGGVGEGVVEDVHCEDVAEEKLTVWMICVVDVGDEEISIL